MRLFYWVAGVGIAVGAALAVWSAPPRPPATAAATAAKLSAADYTAHAAKLAKSLPDGFTILIEKPFVIAADGDAAQREQGQKTVRWTVDHLRKDFFTKDPDHILDIFLFKDKDSYEKNTKDLYHQSPDTPYGFATTSALYMNLSTGGGTLVHEIVHPYIAANFPECPTWFNEGLASLFEQSMDKNGHIVGLTNWRLEPLQKTLRGEGPKEEGRAPTFKTLCSMDAATFYGPTRIPNYGTARYLLYYLQENDVLIPFYKDFLKSQKDDPTGYETLKKTLAGIGENDMDAFRLKWEKWVLALKYP